MRRLATSIVTLALLAFACSSGSGSAPGSGGGGGPLNSPAAVCDATMGKLVKVFDQACTAADKQTEDYQFIAGFLPFFVSICTSSLDASVSTGRASIDYGKASECAAAMDKALTAFSQGGDPGSVSAACSSFVVGKQGAGAPCAQPFECTNELTCVGYNDAQLGKCALPKVGEACGHADGGATTFNFGSDKAECAAGAYCDFGTCAAEQDEGAQCFDDEECKSGLRCYQYACSSTPKATGSACQNDDDCPDGDYCDGTACVNKKSSGAPCTEGGECLGRCDAGSCATFCGVG